MSMGQTRYPAVAGTFYPADPDELRSMIEGFLKEAEQTGPVPKALIVPHAGYVYSGPVAASAYARLIPARNSIRRVVLLGPAHRVGIAGLAVSVSDAFATPLGDVPVDTASIERLLGLPQVHHIEQAHRLEHSLEVHLPFLQVVLDRFTLVPLVVGDAAPQEVGEAIELLWGGPETLVVISSDLSHYHDYDAAKELDRATTRAIESLRFEDIGYEDACGRNPVSGLLLAARRRNLPVRNIDLRNSGDTAGPRDQVVGYGAYVID
jgi:AmmeMemoRadiSam system protein B